MATIVNVPVPIHLPVGLSKAVLRRWRDSLSYVVIGKSSIQVQLDLMYDTLLNILIFLLYAEKQLMEN